MKCPVCVEHHTLQLDAEPGQLRVRRCVGCGGRWIRSDDYWRWRAHQSPGAAGPPTQPVPSSGEGEKPGHRFCPEDGYLLARFLVGSPHEFSIDQCRNCSAVWLDSGEWEALQAAGLSDRLHLILSAEWQDDIRRAEREATERKQWLRQLGEEDLERISDFKAWIDGHPKRSELYAFLRFHERAV
jgi:Zn-finger nucleic acid-binding protein